MGQKQCDNCSEMVDEAKAFCPGCGHAFVEEEKREEESKFDQMDGTMQFGQTMYNQMLSDMGLNISAQPNKQVETVQPASAQVTKPEIPQIVRPAAQQVIKPVAESERSEPGGLNKWVIVGGIAVFLFLILLVAAIIVGYMLWSRFA